MESAYLSFCCHTATFCRPRAQREAAVVQSPNTCSAQGSVYKEKSKALSPLLWPSTMAVFLTIVTPSIWTRTPNLLRRRLRSWSVRSLGPNDIGRPNTDAGGFMAATNAGIFAAFALSHPIENTCTPPSNPRLMCGVLNGGLVRGHTNRPTVWAAKALHKTRLAPFLATACSRVSSRGDCGCSLGNLGSESPLTDRYSPDASATHVAHCCFSATQSLEQSAIRRFLVRL